MTKLTSRMGEVSYVICVLWMAGWSVKSIAYSTDKLKGSVKGIAQRWMKTIGDKAREEMTLEERQAILDEMKIDRRDNGKLAAGHFKAMPLRPVQAKRQASSVLGTRLLSAVKIDTKPAKVLTLQQRRRAERKAREEEEHRKRQKEKGHATRRGDAASALEFLANRHILTDSEDRRVEAFKKDLGSSGRRRLEAGLQLRKYLSGARIGGVKAVDIEASGGGSAIGMPPTAYRLQCLDALGLIRTMMSSVEFAMIEAVVDQDDFPWERAKPVDIEPADEKENAEKKRDRALERVRNKIYEDVRRALDVVAVYEGLLTYEGFAARWGWHLIRVPRTTHQRAAAAAAEAADLLASAGRPT